MKPTSLQEMLVYLPTQNYTLRQSVGKIVGNIETGKLTEKYQLQKVLRGWLLELILKNFIK